MDDKHIVAAVNSECPYCKHKNRHYLRMENTEAHRSLVYCDKEWEGCGAMYAVQFACYMIVSTFVLQLASGPKADTGDDTDG